LKTEERTKNASAGDPPAQPVDRYVKPLSGARTGPPGRVSDALQTDRKLPGWNPGTGWKSQVVDSISGKADNIDRVTLKFDSQQRPHIAYWDSGTGVLRYATLTQRGWHAETVDGGDSVGLYPSMVIDSHDDIYISYYDMANGALRLAHKQAEADQPAATQSSEAKKASTNTAHLE
jgi:hypothetical protein